MGRRWLLMCAVVALGAATGGCARQPDRAAAAGMIEGYASAEDAHRPPIAVVLNWERAVKVGLVKTAKRGLSEFYVPVDGTRVCSASSVGAEVVGWMLGAPVDALGLRGDEQSGRVLVRPTRVRVDVTGIRADHPGASIQVEFSWKPEFAADVSECMVAPARADKRVGTARILLYDDGWRAADVVWGRDRG